MDDAIATGNASWFLTTSERSKLFVRVSGDAGHNLDLDHYLEIGGDTGLRGYPLRYQNGDERAQATVEERLYTDWFLFRLLHIGGAAFFDMGRTWGTTAVPTPQLGMLKDVGVGLRLGNARSAYGSIIHIDLATPLDARGSISKLQFLVSTQQTY
jgi:hemolysin activation/secretion protein